MTWPTYTLEIGTDTKLVPTAWTDLSDRLLWPDGGVGVTVTYGRASELAQDETGVYAFKLDNTDGNWDPGLSPGTPVRLTATLDAVTYPILYGLVESGPAEWPAFGLDAIVNVRAVDGRSLLARVDLDGVTRPRELTGARIAALLDLGGWPAGLRDLDDGRVYMDALDDETLNVLNGIRDAVESEQGQMYVAPDGDFTFRDRHSRLANTSTLTFGGAGEVYRDLHPKYDDSTVWTVGRAEMADGTVFEWVDQVAVDSGLGERVYVVRDLPISDPEAEMLANWMVLRYGQQQRRFDKLEVEGDSTSLDDLMNLRPGHLITVQSAAFPGGTAAIDEDLHVERLAHQIYASKWTSIFQLSPYFGEGPWLTLDHATLGLLGNNKLAP